MQTKHVKKQKNSVKKAVLSKLMSVVLLTSIYNIILQHNLAADRERYGYIARNQAEHIITTIDCVMSRTNTLTTLVKENNGDTSWFD